MLSSVQSRRMKINWKLTHWIGFNYLRLEKNDEDNRAMNESSLIVGVAIVLEVEL